MNTRFIAACIQTTSSDTVEENIAHIAPMAEEAVKGGARFIALPENAFAMRREGEPAIGYRTEEHAGVCWTQDFCAQHNVWMLIGSVRALAEGEKPFNRSVLVNDVGEIVQMYDKIHLFDVTLPNGDRYEESAYMQAGCTPMVAPLPWINLGLSICYDVRFATQYRQMAEAGAEMFAVPAAFTRPTGEAHWKILLQARAIENVAYVIAPAQCGTHPGGRTTYGHSMIVDPWGRVLAEAGDEPGVIMAEIDRGMTAEFRQKIPVLQG